MASLHESGALSDEEFAAAKQKVIEHIARHRPKSGILHPHGRDPRGAVLRRAIETCISPDDDAIANLGELFTDDATLWSPNMLAVGLADLAENLTFRETAFSDVDLQIDTLDIFGSRGLAEFRVAATFSGPFVIDEAVVIGPTGSSSCSPRRPSPTSSATRSRRSAPTSTTPACWSR